EVAVAFPDDFPGDDAPASEPAIAEGVAEVGPGTWEAPPVRGAALETPPAADAPPIEAPAFVPQAPPPTHRSRLRPLLAIAVMAILLTATIGVGFLVVEGARTGSEAERFKRAQELYDQGDYAEAHEVLNKLVR